MDERSEGTGRPGVDGHDADAAPTFRPEWPALRIAVEPLLGAAAGALLAHLLPGAQAATGVFAAVGAGVAPLSLLLTPRRGSPPFRAVRYGLAAAVIGALAASFLVGAEGLRFEELIGLGALLFLAAGTLHLGLAVTVDRDVGVDRPPGGRWDGEEG